MIFNITSTSSDLTGTTLVVKTLAGVTVTITKDEKSKVQIANSNGIAIFEGLEIGTWTVTITDGRYTAQKTVTITADYAITMTLSYDLSLTSDYFNAGLSLSGYNNASHAVSKFSCTKEAIDLTDFSTLSATLFAESASIYITLYISTTTSKNNAVASAGMPGPNSSGSSRRIDISRFSGEYYIILEVVCNGYTYKTNPGGARDIILT